VRHITVTSEILFLMSTLRDSAFRAVGSRDGELLFLSFLVSNVSIFRHNRPAGHVDWASSGRLSRKQSQTPQNAPAVRLWRGA
jgi:hypothetical protein